MNIVDLDDFCDDERSLESLILLDKLKEELPTFKATLFTIPARCSISFVQVMKDTRPWLDLVAHGWLHNSNRECQNWNRLACLDAIEGARMRGLTTKGFKAPGWQISDGCYVALEVLGYWVADQEYNDARRPCALRAYVIKNETPHHVEGVGSMEIGTWSRTSPYTASARAIHGHIGHLGGHNANALELIYDQILEAGRKDPDFRFIDEVM